MLINRAESYTQASQSCPLLMDWVEGWDGEVGAACLTSNISTWHRETGMDLESQSFYSRTHLSREQKRRLLNLGYINMHVDTGLQPPWICLPLLGVGERSEIPSKQSVRELRLTAGGGGGWRGSAGGASQGPVQSDSDRPVQWDWALTLLGWLLNKTLTFICVFQSQTGVPSSFSL